MTQPVGQAASGDTLLVSAVAPLAVVDALSVAQADTRIEIDKHNNKFLIFMATLPLVVIKIHGLSVRT